MPGLRHMKDAFGKKLRPDNDFRTLEPLADKHHSTLSAIRSYFTRTVLGVRLAIGAITAFGASEIACSPAQNSDTVVTPAAALTDSDGKAALDVNGWGFTLAVNDRYTSKPVSGAGILLFAKGNNADYFVLDPQNRYLPFFGGATGFYDTQVQTQNNPTPSDAQPLDPSAVSWWNSNALLTPPTPPLCGVSTGIKMDLGIANWILQSPLFTVEKSGVRLSDLNITMSQLVSGQAAGMAAQTGAVMVLPRVPALGISKATAEAIGHDLDGVGWILLGLTACADNQLDAYGNYYRSLCYEDSATFTIYGINGLTTLQALANLPIIDLFLGFDSPFFIVAPELSDASPPNSTPPYAIVNAASFQVNPPDAGVGNPAPNYNSFDIKEVDGKLPSFTAIATLGVSPTEIILNACSNLNLAYEISSPSGRTYEGGTPDVEPATNVPLAVQNKDDYSLNFYLQASQTFSQTCPGGYQTYYNPNSSAANSLGGTHHDLAVACNAPDGYVVQPPAIDAQDGGVVGSGQDAGVALYCPGVTDFSCGFGPNDSKIPWTAGHLTFSSDFSQDTSQNGNITVVCNSTGATLLDAAVLSMNLVYSWSLKADKNSTFNSTLDIIYVAANGNFSFSVQWPDNSSVICQ